MNREALAVLAVAGGLTVSAQIPADVLMTAPVAQTTAPATFTFVAGEMIGEGVKAAPYSAEAVTESVQTLADGNRVVNRSSAMVYRDSQGRERREQTLPRLGPFNAQVNAQGESPKMIMIFDPVAGVNYSLDPARKEAIKMPVPKWTSAMPVPPPPPGAQAVFERRIEVAHAPTAGVAVAGGAIGMGAGPGVAGNVMFMRSAGGTATFVGAGEPVKPEQLGSRVIEGVAADGTRSLITIPAGQMGNERPIEITDEVWRSSELKIVMQSEHSDPRMGKTTYSLKNVSRAEPASTLFQVPPDYTVKDVAMAERVIEKIERRQPE